MGTLNTKNLVNDYIEELKEIDSELVKGALLGYLREKGEELENANIKYDNALNKLTRTLNENGDEYLTWRYNDIEKAKQNRGFIDSILLDVQSFVRKYIKERHADGTEKRANIENLNQLKKALVEGARFNIVDHKRKPEFIGQKRVVQATQTNAIYSGIAGYPEHELSRCNGGKGLFMQFLKAKNWDFDNGLCTNYSIYKTWENGEQVEKREPSFTIEVLAQ